ncbi:MAG: hypothetical protein FWG25_00745 [Promicromonosporaceae bacterium]|nr:hypothetical protein [Promicromonosporaceae bacterium]
MTWGTFGFNFIGLAFWLAVQVPNAAWVRRKPRGYRDEGENRVLVVLERLGQAGCTATILFFTDTIPRAWSPWISWFLAAMLLMIVYEGYWLRYFRSDRSLAAFYRPFLGVPLPGATLPVFAFLLLGIYGRLLCPTW